MSDDLLLRVAALAGWQNVAKSTLTDHYFGTKDGDSRGYPIPLYTTSIDTIWSLFEEFGLYPLLEKLPLQNTQASEQEYSCSHYLISKSDYVLESRGATPAIALCNLLVAISEKIE